MILDRCSVRCPTVALLLPTASTVAFVVQVIIYVHILSSDESFCHPGHGTEKVLAPLLVPSGALSKKCQKWKKYILLIPTVFPIVFLSLKWVTLTRNVRGREFTCGCYVLQETTKKSQEFFHWWGEFLLLYMSFYFILTLHNAAVQSLLLRHAVLCVSRLRVWKLRRRHGPSATPPRNWGASLSVTSARRAGYTTSRFSQTRGR